MRVVTNSTESDETWLGSIASLMDNEKAYYVMAAIRGPDIDTKDSRVQGYLKVIFTSRIRRLIGVQYRGLYDIRTLPTIEAVRLEKLFSLWSREVATEYEHFLDHVELALISLLECSTTLGGRAIDEIMFLRGLKKYLCGWVDNGCSLKEFESQNKENFSRFVVD